MSTHPRRLLLAVVSVAALIGSAPALRAETLADALALAYQSNPTLQSQRALQRQLDETYVQARTGWRPTVNGTGVASYSNQQSPIGNNNNVINRLGATVSAGQPIFTNGRVSAQVDAAEATIRAGREGLRATEATILQQVVQSYQDVLRDQQVVAIRQQSADVLARQLLETRARFEVGLITLTDVARAEAQVAAARAQLATARATLQNSRAAYAAVVGQTPAQLETPPTLPGLPESLDAAVGVAETSNPNLLRAMLAEHASRARVAQIRAQKGPTVTLNASAGYSGTYDPLGPFNRNLAFSANASIPLFTGGLLNSQVRAAVEQNSSDRVLIEQSRRTMVQTLSVAWNQMLAARANIASNEEQVRAALVAFEGSQEQFRVGLATTLDVLLTQETLRAAQLALVQAQRDLYVAQAQVLGAVGRLELAALAQNVPTYDPKVNFEKVRNAGALPWEPIVRAIDRDRDADDITSKIAPQPPSALGAPALNPGTSPSVLGQAEATLGSQATMPTTGLPAAGARDTPR